MKQELERYTQIAGRIKEKSKEPRSIIERMYPLVTGVFASSSNFYF